MLTVRINFFFSDFTLFAYNRSQATTHFLVINLPKLQIKAKFSSECGYESVLSLCSSALAIFWRQCNDYPLMGIQRFQTYAGRLRHIIGFDNVRAICWKIKLRSRTSIRFNFNGISRTLLKNMNWMLKNSLIYVSLNI